MELDKYIKRTLTTEYVIKQMVKTNKQNVDREFTSPPPPPISYTLVYTYVAAITLGLFGKVAAALSKACNSSVTPVSRPIRSA